jgi:5-oxoprolinase (ATP-hydrolysing) subunit C
MQLDTAVTCKERRMFEVLEGGIQTTIQDFPGRAGLLDQGICPAGPMDSLAFRSANILVGNEAGTAGLEVTAGGLRLRFDSEAVISVTGADTQPKINGEPIDIWRSYRVNPEDVLALGFVRGNGFRSYVAVSGGIDIPEYLGSRATYVPGQIGGLEGRALTKGDRLALGAAIGDGKSLENRRVRSDVIPSYPSEWELEAVPGPQASPDYFTPDDYEHFFSHSWKLDRNSNRMGYRLESTKWQWARKTGGIAGGHPSNILDNGYAVGAVNISGDQPIILCMDGPTLGGFICCAGVAYGALWKLGQMVPGRDHIRFKELTLDEAVGLAQHTNSLVSEESLEGVA